MYLNVDEQVSEQLIQSLKWRVCPRSYVRAYIDFPKPLIAVINGPAVGVSVTLLGLFDIVYATERVRRLPFPPTQEETVPRANNRPENHSQ